VMTVPFPLSSVSKALSETVLEKYCCTYAQV
jgi:hypothetical protein